MSLSKLTKEIEKLEFLYGKKGYASVLDYALRHPSKFETNWEYCRPCEIETPSLKGAFECSVCGTSKI